MTDHRDQAERCLPGAESGQGAALVHAVLALADEVKTLREAVAPPIADEAELEALGAEIAVVPSSNGRAPLSSLADDAIIRTTDYPPSFGLPAIDRECPVCKADPGEPCRVPGRPTREGLAAHVYPPPYVHRARFDGIPF